ncbi:lytic transglycosylase domain-containing protein [Noviherbaspirillum cavernae]|uniref:Lytic transglycosylase domain-containing protein n=1 Tax=Noviherbaspirillum cavernae TaxID=2320862 RepID=A0A418X5W1_9BURK|nr:lytic transglycosylase domain-containing protein [Noviherbaspirillum cavernae]RJG07766.1 lytic transglycosylase domain-containing protein [Noviherbaspirillum cavernae]
MKWIAGVTFALASVSALLPAAHAQKRVENFATDDDVFLALRAASNKGDAAKADELASRLANYAIPSYVDYYRLRPRIGSAPEQEIRDFLTRYDGSAIADRLRNDWLLELGRTRNWILFDEQYPLFALNDDTQLKCYALMSKALKGRQVTDEARALLVAPQNYGEACPSLMATLVQGNQFSADDVWAQIRLMAESGNGGAIRRIAGLTTASETAIMQATDKPQAVVARGAGNGRDAHEIFMLALGRVAKGSLTQAVSALVASAERLNERERAIAWSQIAYQASLQLAPDAVVYWHRTSGVPLSSEAHQWKVRAALRAGDWKFVKSSIEAMPAHVRNDATWIYWLGRAHKAEGNNEEAQTQFLSLVAQTSFYGQLALEELGQKITIPPRAQPVTQDEIAPIAENQGFGRAFKFFDLNLRFEGYREWNWELRRMNERQHLAAAEFARQRNVLDRMVNTSDRTKAEFDFTQRFPSPFRDVMHSNTQRLGLDMAWVYGLIRQESRFILNARSHVGASGLMQLMPATAKWVAGKIGIGGFSLSQVNDINTNILLGTNYLNMVLNDLEGSQAMATAAYNAGPGRPRAWRSTLAGPVEGAIFAESIPFNETRDYVKKVLSNATYYAALFESKPQSLKARLGMVAPKGFAPSDLP